MKTIKVFLSGGIDGLEDRGATWRKEATHKLEGWGYTVLNPLDAQLENRFKQVNEVVHHDEHLRRQADLLLVEYAIPNRCCVGTDFELTRAHDQGQPTIVWAHKEVCERVYLQYLSTVIVPTLEEALEYIQRYYPTGVM